MNLGRFACTIRALNPETGHTLDEHVLPVDSPDAEHAAASTPAIATSFTPNATSGTELAPVAFRCTHIALRT